MKALSTTILIVVTAVVILVAALVLLTIFGSGIQNVTTIAQAKSMCMTEGQIACGAGIWPPATWNVPTKLVQGESATRSCAGIEGLSSCGCDNRQLTGCK